MRAAALFAVGVFAALVLTTSVAQSLTPQLVESRNEAAGFAGTMKFAIGRAARDCRDALGKDDAYMQAIVNNWLNRNGGYSSAAERWESFVVSTIANHDGLSAGLQARNQLLATSSKIGSEKSDQMIGASDDERKAKCQSYASDIHAGRYDITSASPEYQNLAELVDYFKSSAPPPWLK